MFDCPAATNTSPTYTFARLNTVSPLYAMVRRYGLSPPCNDFIVQVNAPLFLTVTAAETVVLPCVSVADSLDWSMASLPESSFAAVAVPWMTSGLPRWKTMFSA